MMPSSSLAAISRGFIMKTFNNHSLRHSQDHFNRSVAPVVRLSRAKVVRRRRHCLQGERNPFANYPAPAASLDYTKPTGRTQRVRMPAPESHFKGLSLFGMGASFVSEMVIPYFQSAGQIAM